MKLFLLSSTLVVGLSGGASAADVLSPEAVAPAFSWTGGYAGAQAGYLWGEGCFCIDVLPDVAADGDVNGWLGGFYAGYNFQFANNLVLGVDADITRYGADQFVEYTAPGGSFPPQSGIDYKLKWGGAAKLRAGYAIDRWMPYVAGGVAFAATDLTAQYNGRVTARNDPTMVGWTLGAGVDYALTDKIIGRAEYRYTDYGDFDLSAGAQNGRGQIKGSELRLGIAYKF